MKGTPGVTPEGTGTAAPAYGPSRFLTPKSLARLRLGLTLATFAILAWYLRTRPHADLSALSLRWGFAAAACGCVLPLLLLRAAKWKILLRGSAPGATFAQAFRSYLGALALALVTPGRVGEFSRGLYLPHREVQGWRGAGLVLIDNWIDFLAVLAWACLGWAVLFGGRGLALGGVLLLVFAPIPIWLRAGRRFISRLPERWDLRGSAEKMRSAGEKVSGRDWAEAGCAGVVAFGLEWLQIAFLIAFLTPAAAEPLRLAGLMALVTLANSFQVTLAGLGVREGVSALLLAKEGIGAEVAILAAFIQAVLNLFLPAVLGLLVKPVALYPSESDR